MIVDFHTHIVPPRIIEKRSEIYREDRCLGELFSDPNSKMATAKDLIESMDKDDIDISVVTNMGWSSLELCRETNDYIMESVNKYPDRLIGFCTVNPSWNEASAEVERCAKGGLRGIGELMPHLQGFDLGNKDVMLSVMEVAMQNNMLVMTHSSEPVGHMYSGKGNVTPEVLYNFVSNFPEARIICAHWGGGLPFYALMPEVGRRLENVYFDTAASPFLYRYDVFTMVLELVGLEKILFGSDFPLIPQKRIITGLNEKIDLPNEYKARILGENARELLGLR